LNENNFCHDIVGFIKNLTVMLLLLWLISIHFSAFSSSTLVLVFDFYTYSELDIKIMGGGSMVDINIKIIKFLSHGITHSKLAFWNYLVP